MSKTLRDLWEESLPGTKFRIKGWPENDFFTPYYQDKNGFICGLKQDGQHDVYIGSSPAFEIYQEPKPKVERWLWVITSAQRGIPELCDFFYTEEQAKELFGDRIICKATSFGPIKWEE